MYTGQMALNLGSSHYQLFDLSALFPPFHGLKPLPGVAPSFSLSVKPSSKE